MVNNFIDGAWDKIGNLFTALHQGNFNMENILGAMVSGMNSVARGVLNAFQGGKANELASKLTGYIGDLMSGSGAAEAFKGMLKNGLGRPQAIAWQSLLSGSPAGVWHVMVGNPRNPILSIGNLILENATITQSGPLGIDDFPSELKVSVELKHCTPRDVTDIGRMYTKGAGAIYHVLAGHNVDDFWNSKAVENLDNGEEVIANTAPKTENNDASKSQKDAGSKQGQASKTSRNTIFTEKELAQAQNGQSYYNSVGLTSVQEGDDPSWGGYPNPFVTTDAQCFITRSNNWSKSMLRYALDESA